MNIACLSQIANLRDRTEPYTPTRTVREVRQYGAAPDSQPVVDTV